jgi:hypothetical protein
MSASNWSSVRPSLLTVVCMLPLVAVSIGSLAWNESDPVPALAASVVARLQQISEWTDAFPESIVDSGRWSFAADLLDLKSDNDRHLENRGLRDSRFVVFCLSRPRRRELRIVGVADEIGKLEKRFRESPTPAPDPQFLVMLYSRERQQIYRTQEVSRLAKNSLMRRLAKRSSSR